MAKQKLSATAAAAKKKRDLRYANSSDRRGGTQSGCKKDGTKAEYKQSKK